MKFLLAIVASASATAWAAWGDAFTPAKAEGGLCVRTADAGYKVDAGDCTTTTHQCCYAWTEDDPYFESEFVKYTNEGAANTYCFDASTWGTVQYPYESNTQADLWAGASAMVIQATTNAKNDQLSAKFVDCNGAAALAATATLVAAAALF